MKTRQNQMPSKECFSSEDAPQTTKQASKRRTKTNNDVQQYKNRGKKGPNHKDLKCT